MRLKSLQKMSCDDRLYPGIIGVKIQSTRQNDQTD